MTAPRLLVVLLLALGLVASACGGSGGPSVEEYSDAVVLNRNRTDYVLGRITRAQSLEELFTRMDEAALTISKAADELEDTGAPSDYQPEADELVKWLRQLSVDVQATADQARIPGFESLITQTNAISFDSWDKVNKALAGLAGKGIEVMILQRHSAQ
jgi:hypothetical protein